jgi:uncharacterized protein
MRPIVFSLVVLVVLSGLVFGLVRLLHPEWWRMRRVRWVLLRTPIVGAIGLVAWGLPVALDARPWAVPGAFVTSLVFVLLFLLVVSLPVSGLLAAFVRAGDALRRLWLRRGTAPGAPTPAPSSAARPSRRDVLIHATALLPGAALATAGVGVVSAFRPAHLERVPLLVPGLAPSLEGLRILQLTDIHIGTFVDLDALESVLESCESARPDVVVVTGDACDDLESLEPAVRLIQGLRPRLGTFASLGNHEYYRGEAAFRRAYDRAGIPLLVDAGVRLPVGDASLYLAGADDPAIMGQEMQPFLERSITRALADRHTDEPVVLLSHRPDGFDAAARHGVTLTLSGHTHGGQIGVGERSLFEPLFPKWYLRGRYERDGATLFTSSGFGHWFPFRLDCPAQVPLITLQRA